VPVSSLYPLLLLTCVGSATTTNNGSRQKRTDYFEDDNETFDSSHTIQSQVFTNRSNDRGRSFGGRGRSGGFGRRGSPSMGDDGHQPSNRFSDDLELKISSGDVGRIIGVVVFVVADLVCGILCVCACVVSFIKSFHV